MANSFSAPVQPESFVPRLWIDPALRRLQHLRSTWTSSRLSETERACPPLWPATFPITRLQCATSTANGRKAEEVRNCSTDEGRPLGVGFEEQTPNHLRRLWPKATVVNAEGKGLELLGKVTGKKRTAREPLMKCRNVIDDVQNRGLITTAEQASTIPAYGRSGIRHERWPELAMRQLNGTWEPELRCKRKSHKWEEPMRAKLRMRSSGRTAL